MREQFYALLEPSHCKLSVSTQYQLVDNINVGKAPMCPECGEPIGSLEWLPPYEVEIEVWEEGDVDGYPDILFGSSDDLLASERFVMAFKDARLTGLRGFDQVKVIKETVRHSNRSSRPSRPDYFRVVVEQSRAIFDDEKSGAEWGIGWSACPECRGTAPKRWKRVALQHGSWSGEDVFTARGLAGVILVSQKFKDFCDREKFQHLCIRPAESYSHDLRPWEQ